jgi:HK97 family phage major capsid protein
MSEIKEMLNGNDVDIESLETEVAELKEARAMKIEKEEKRQAMLNDIAEEKVEVKEEKIETEERKTMTLAEIRKSNEYAQAYARFLVSNDDTECRTLLTDQVQGGYVPVPTFLEEKIQTAWEKSEILDLVKKTYFKGIVKVGFELSASDASIHVEGADAPNQETLTFGSVEIKPQTIKKWIKLSDEAVENTTIDMVDYIYDELTHKIVEYAETIIINKIASLPAQATSSSVSAGVVTITEVAKNTILNAVVQLQAGARDLHLVMNRGTYAALRSLELDANYGVDVFEGLRDRIIFTNALKSVDSASEDDVVIIVGDFNFVQANFPAGQDVKVKYDDLTEAEADLVKFVGKMNVGVGVIGDKAFTNVVMGAQG